MNKISSLIGSSIHELIQVTQTKRYRCVQCGSGHNVKTRSSVLDKEPLLNLNLPALPKAGNNIRHGGNAVLTLEDCLESNARSDLEWRCENCLKKPSPPSPEQKQAAVRNMWKKVHYPPEVLLLRLARFKARLKKGEQVFRKGSGAVFDKDCAKVAIPEVLDLTSFVETRGVSGSLLTRYRLQSIISHQGTQEGGHYITHICRDGKWSSFNDDKDVQQTTLSKILNQPGEFTPYVLLYEKIVQDDVTEDHHDKDGNGSTSGDNNTDKENDDGDGPDGNDSRCKQCQDALPTCVDTSQTFHGSSTETRLQLATTEKPTEGQLFITADASFGQYKISFPTYVQENYKTQPGEGIGGSGGGTFTLKLRDSRGWTGQSEGRATFTRTFRVEIPQPTIAGGDQQSNRTHAATRSPPQTRSNGNNYTGLGMDGACDMSPTGHPLPNVRHKESAGYANTATASKQTTYTRNSSSLFGTPYVQANLRSIFDKMQAFFEREIARELREKVIPGYEKERAGLRTRIMELEGDLALMRSTDTWKTSRLTDFWKNREAEQQAKNQEQSEKIAFYESIVQALPEQVFLQLVQYVEETYPTARAGSGVGSKRPRGQSYDADDEIEGVDGHNWDRVTKRPRYSDEGPHSSLEVDVGYEGDLSNMKSLTPDGYFQMFDEADVGDYDSDGNLIESDVGYTPPESSDEGEMEEAADDNDTEDDDETMSETDGECLYDIYDSGVEDEEEYDPEKTDSELDELMRGQFYPYDYEPYKPWWENPKYPEAYQEYLTVYARAYRMPEDEGDYLISEFVKKMEAQPVPLPELEPESRHPQTDYEPYIPWWEDPKYPESYRE